MERKLVIIGGPTAAGKTTLALKLAREFRGEIVSADSRQIYKEMDIGTGKELPESIKYQVSSIEVAGGYDIGYYEIEGVRIWLYDVVKPNQPFSAVDYRRAAGPVLADIWRRGKLPLVVGGTGFYIRALLKGFESEGVPPDWELRERLRYYDIKILREMLEKICPERVRRMNESDRQNPRRLIRAIEIASRVQGAGFREEKKGKAHPFFLALTAPYPELYRRIDARVEEMVKQGLLAEVKKLVRQYGWAAPGLSGIGYQQFRPYLEKQVSLVDCVQQVKYDTHAYARRQMTWFRRMERIHWLDVACQGFDEQALNLVKSFLR